MNRAVVDPGGVRGELTLGRGWSPRRQVVEGVTPDEVRDSLLALAVTAARQRGESLPLVAIDERGAEMHLLVAPDGDVSLVSEPGARAVGRPRRRGVVVAGTTALLLLALGAVSAGWLLIRGRDSDSSPVAHPLSSPAVSGSSTPGVPSTPTPSVSPLVRTLGVAAKSKRPGLVELKVIADELPVRVQVALVGPTGQTRERLLRVGSSPRLVTFEGLRGGVWSWEVSAPRADRVKGRVQVRPAVPATPQVAPAPSVVVEPPSTPQPEPRPAPQPKPKQQPKPKPKPKQQPKPLPVPPVPVDPDEGQVGPNG